MKALLIPVKDLRQAKQRLAPHLTQAQRTALAQAMFDDVCAAAATVRGINHIFLVSNYEPALERAKRLGWQPIPESIQSSESDSVDYASRICAERGVNSLLRLPIDVPLVETRDIEVLFEQAGEAPSVVVVPSRSDKGTNALLRTPPTLFPSHFGLNSFPKHLAEARRKKFSCKVVRNLRIELDIDDVDDLRELLAWGETKGATGRWLERVGFGATGTSSKPAHAGDANEHAGPAVFFRR